MNKLLTTFLLLPLFAVGVNSNDTRDMCKQSSLYFIKGRKDFVTYDVAQQNKNLIHKIMVRYCPDTLPEFLFDFSNLQELDLDLSNRLKHISIGITRLKKLKKLNMSVCSSIKEIPKSVCQLFWLEELNISKCRLKKLPDEIGNLQNLRTLYMVNNIDLIVLPESFGKLKKLVTLEMFNTSITEIPKSFSNLTNLRQVTVLNLDLQQKICARLPHLHVRNEKNWNNNRISWIR